MPMVKAFHSHNGAEVPQVSSHLSLDDFWGTIGARTGVTRNGYSIPPGLYCLGTPDKNSPVLVTGNYKLSFDILRKDIKKHNVWILVIDTRGINVWCAAGKKTFSTEEVVYQVQQSNLSHIVAHRELILPQYGAIGVEAHKLKKSCGFKGIFGPIKSSDIDQFLTTGKVSEEMRTTTFTIFERLTLVPVELLLIWRQVGISMIAIFLLSGISIHGYSASQAWIYGSYANFFTLLGVLAGAFFTPAMLPFIPFTQFWLKGVVAGLLFTLTGMLFFPAHSLFEGAALVLWTTGVASFLAMNFTGSTPFTSLTGVKKEMTRGVPVQIILILLATLCWITTMLLL